MNNEVYPVWTYSYLGFLAFVGPVTEVIGYKTMINIQVAMHVVTYSILIWGEVSVAHYSLSCPFIFWLVISSFVYLTDLLTDDFLFLSFEFFIFFFFFFRLLG